MDNKVTTCFTLWNLVEIDQKDHKLKEMTTLLLNAMRDWPTYNQTEIVDFIYELKVYFGNPLTIEKIESVKFDGQNGWKVEAGSSIAELISISKEFYNELDFDKIVANILDYYNIIFDKVDFIAELEYFTPEQGGRSTPAKSGYRPQVKFDFEKMQTSGQQTFIDKEIVYPGEKVLAKIKIVSPEFFANSLSEGTKFEFREGPIIIGTGEIKYIVNDKLEKGGWSSIIREK